MDSTQAALVYFIILVANIGTAVDYGVIGFRMLQSIFRHERFPTVFISHPMTWLYGAFILVCGIAHGAMGIAVALNGHMMTWYVAVSCFLMFSVSTPVAMIIMIRPGQVKHMHLPSFTVSVRRSHL